jgi:hypothetical protein
MNAIHRIIDLISTSFIDGCWTWRWKIAQADCCDQHWTLEWEEGRLVIEVGADEEVKEREETYYSETGARVLRAFSFQIDERIEGIFNIVTSSWNIRQGERVEQRDWSLKEWNSSMKEILLHNHHLTKFKKRRIDEPHGGFTNNDVVVSERCSIEIPRSIRTQFRLMQCNGEGNEKIDLTRNLAENQRKEKSDRCHSEINWTARLFFTTISAEVTSSHSSLFVSRSIRDIRKTSEETNWFHRKSRMNREHLPAIL